MKISGRFKAIKEENRGSVREGSFMEAHIGEKSVHKIPRAVAGMPKEAIQDIHERRLRKVEEDYLLADAAGLPLAKLRGRGKLNGKDSVVFEKVHILSPEERIERASEIGEIIDKSSEKGINFDANIHNFGARKSFFSKLLGTKGKIVILDADVKMRIPENMVTPESRAQYSGEMNRQVEESIDRMQMPTYYKRELKGKFKRE